MFCPKHPDPAHEVCPSCYIEEVDRLREENERLKMHKLAVEGYINQATKERLRAEKAEAENERLKEQISDQVQTTARIASERACEMIRAERAEADREAIRIDLCAEVNKRTQLEAALAEAEEDSTTIYQDLGKIIVSTAKYSAEQVKLRNAQADFAAARTALAGRTYYHSDKAVEEELAAVKVELKKLKISMTGDA